MSKGAHQSSFGRESQLSMKGWTTFYVNPMKVMADEKYAVCTRRTIKLSV